MREQLARRVVEVVAVQVGDEHGVDARDGGLGAAPAGRTSGLGRGFGVFGHGLARAGRIELRVDQQRVARGRRCAASRSGSGSGARRRLAQPLLESLSVSLREFYAPHYTVTRSGRGRAAGALARARSGEQGGARGGAVLGRRPGAVVEIGCGDGALLAALSERGIGSRLDGFEISPEAAALARLKDIPRVGRIEAYDGERDPRRGRRVRPGGALARGRARPRARAAAARGGAAGAAGDRRGAAGGEPLGAAAVGAGRGGADRSRARVRPRADVRAVRPRRASTSSRS